MAQTPPHPLLQQEGSRGVGREHSPMHCYPGSSTQPSTLTLQQEKSRQKQVNKSQPPPPAVSHPDSGQWMTVTDSHSEGIDPLGGGRGGGGRVGELPPHQACLLRIY